MIQSALRGVANLFMSDWRISGSPAPPACGAGPAGQVRGAAWAIPPFMRSIILLQLPIISII